MKLLNSFSLNMLGALNGTLIVKEISLDEARKIAAADIESAVGHADTAAVFAEQLGATVPANRANVSLPKGETVLVGQLRGPRLPEGATTLPPGATIVWCTVEVA